MNRARHWRILNVDDQSPSLEDDILKEMIERPREDLATLGLRWMEDAIPNMGEFATSAARLREAEAAIEKGVFCHRRLLGLTSAWVAMERLFKEEIPPDLCFFDVKHAADR